MIELPKPDIILTHESDLDGLVAGVLLKRLASQVFEADIELEAWNYNGWRQRPMNERSAWVTDLSLEPRIDKPGWVIIDHHASGTHPKHATLVHDPAKSSSLLCYELCRERGLNSPELGRLVHLTNVADLFLEDDPDFVLANDYANLVKTYQFWSLYRLTNGEIEQLLDHPLLEVMAAKRRIEDPIGLKWCQDNVTELSPEVGLVDTVVGNTNLLVHQMLAEKSTRYAVLITLFHKASGSTVASLRSRNGQAIRVAERLQGGGHENAAGALLPRFVRSRSDAVDYLRQVLNPRPEPPLTDLQKLFEAIETPGK